MTTKTRILRIANSRAFRVPKPLLDRAQLPEEVEVRAELGRLVVTGIRRPRAGWAAAAPSMRLRNEDRLLDEFSPTRLDEREWR
jgi:antitoxin component of MazEF toxin-antitoxin module